MSVTRASAAIAVGFLGGFTLTGIDAERVAEFARQPKRIALLALLAVAPDGQPVRRETIAALLWPESDRERSRASVRNALYQIRTILGADLVRRHGDEDLSLDRALADDDVTRLDRAAAAGDDAAVMATYRGPFLEGLHLSGAGIEWDEWADNARRRFTTVAQRSAWRHAGRLEHAGDATGALHAAHWAITLNGLDELAFRRAIELALRVGDRGTALGMYAELERRLAREFDVAPSPETARLIAGVRQDRAAGDERRPLRVVRATADGSPAADAGGPWRPSRRAGRGGALVRPTLVGVAAGLSVLALLPIARSVGIVREPPAIEATWTSIGAGVSLRPTARSQAAYALDSVGGIVQFGGVADASGDASEFRIKNDLWQLLGATSAAGMEWRPVEPVGAVPRARWIARAVGDPSHDRVYVFGGAHGTTSPCANDTWVVEGASTVRGPARWRRVTASHAPSPRADFTFAFDTASGALLVFGGHDCVRQRFGDLWALDTRDAAAAWHEVRPDSSSGAPGPRSSAASVWDPVGRRLLVFGGRDDRAPIGGLWELSLVPAPRWTPRVCDGDAPPPMTGGMAAYDARRDRMIVVGGVTAEGHALSTVWLLDGTRGARCRWSKAVVRGDPIPARGYGFLAWDDAAQMAVAVGGVVAYSGLNDVWQLRLHDGAAIQ